MIGMKVIFKTKEQSSEAEQRQLMSKLVEVYKNVPGIKQKYFLADPKTGEVGGFYAFESQEAVDEYLKSDVYKQVVLSNTQVEPKVETFIIIDSGVLM
ncbi:MAG: YdhR family protein [Dehalococcoidia bacterium]